MTVKIGNLIIENYDDEESFGQQVIANIYAAAEKILEKKGIWPQQSQMSRNDLLDFNNGQSPNYYCDAYLQIKRVRYNTSSRRHAIDISLFIPLNGILTVPVDVFISVSTYSERIICTLLREGVWLTYLREVHARIVEEEESEAKVIREELDKERLKPIDDVALFQDYFERGEE